MNIRNKTKLATNVFRLVTVKNPCWLLVNSIQSDPNPIPDAVSYHDKKSILPRYGLSRRQRNLELISEASLDRC